MLTTSTIKFLYDYNYWANARVLAACEALTPEQWDQSLGHSWGSVHGLLTHIFAAEVIWLERWKGNSPKSPRKPGEFPTLADLRGVWKEHEAAIREFVNSCTDESLQRNVTYTSLAGETFTLALGPLMLHLANHGTHHRGELAAMLAVLNVPHPEDDLLFYLQERR